MSPAPLVIPGEDRTFGSGLFVDLVPRTSWLDNARAAMTLAAWKSLSAQVAARADNHCEACGAPRNAQRRHWIEAHERWAYEGGVQSLRRLVALCSPCHRATHFGFAQSQGRGPVALRHLQKVNQWTPAQAERHVREAFGLWSVRSAQRWVLDLSILENAGFIPPVPSPCTKLCQLDAAGVCLGCKRTRQEIAAWPSLGSVGQRLLLDDLARR